MEYVAIVLKIDFKKLSIIISGSSPAEGEKPTSGVLTSPNYPYHYPNDFRDIKYIRVPEGNTIWMRFSEPFDIERNADWVVINDGDGSILWRSQDEDFWEMRDRQFVSNTHFVELQFDTDGSVTGPGWRLEWGKYERNPDCVYYKFSIQLSGMVGEGGSLPKSGVLKSPEYPYNYPNDHDSIQTVEVAEGKTIRYVWTNFHTEGGLGPDGPFDYVEIEDEDGTILMSKNYGSSLPSPGTSNSNIMYVKFATDGDTTRPGWRLEWNEQ